jgi:hypothetical protein
MVRQNEMLGGIGPEIKNSLIARKAASDTRDSGVKTFGIYHFHLSEILHENQKMRWFYISFIFLKIAFFGV